MIVNSPLLYQGWVSAGQCQEISVLCLLTYTGWWTIFHIWYFYFSLDFYKIKKQPKCEMCKNTYCRKCMVLNVCWRYTIQCNILAKQPPCKLESHGTGAQHSEAYIWEHKLLPCHLEKEYIKQFTRMAVGRPDITAIYWYGRWL